MNLKTVALICMWAVGMLTAMQAAAWDVRLKTVDSNGGVDQVWVHSAREQKQVDVYIAWFDRDGNEAGFQSWLLEGGWHPGLTPVLRNADIPKLDAFYLADVPRACPKEHRCFLALVATPAGVPPLEIESWREAALLPLSLAAGQDRLPGQSVFFNAEQESLYRNIDSTAVTGVAEAENVAFGPPAAPAAAAPEKAADSGAQTEKPDIFRREGNTLLYANGQAGKLQLIDIANPAQPRLQAETKLVGTPLEIYKLGEFFVLLASDYSSTQGTRMTVFRLQEGRLITASETVLDGQFMESRRRDQTIYSVAQHYSNGNTELQIQALMLDELGHAVTSGQTKIPGYDAKVAIFPDHLVIANRNPNKWNASMVQVFDLSQAQQPLQDAGMVEVNGYIPSEFHLDVQNHQLRLVYGPEDRKAGSTLAVYDVPMPGAGKKITLVGQVANIAPGEALFATRFVKDLAYVVTYQRTDPLWVISLANPAKPEILGELIVPGWSEKLFFHDNKLFAVGMHDQLEPGETETWVRRVAVSLFDVTTPTAPTLLDRFVPLAKDVRGSTSPALEDERALLLDWEQSFAALPLESWETDAGSHLQLVDFSKDRFNDAGRVDIGVPVLRSLELDPGLLGVLGDQSYLSVQWGNGKASVLGEVELAANLAWLRKEGKVLWAAAMGNRGYHRLYALDPETLQPLAPTARLPRGYNGVVQDNGVAVFYDLNPLAIQVVQNNVVHSAQTLEQNNSSDTVWHHRTEVFLTGDKLYLAEQNPQDKAQPDFVDAPTLAQRWGYTEALWTVRVWRLQDGKAVDEVRYPVPGELAAVLPDGRVVTKEWNEKGSARLNLLRLNAEKAQFVNAFELPCHYYQASVQWLGEQLYATCRPGTYSPYYYFKNNQENGGTTTPNTRLWRMDTGRWLAKAAEWELEGNRELVQAEGNVILTRGGYSWDEPLYDVMPMVGVANSKIMVPDYYPSTNSCEVLRLEQKPVSLGKVADCPYADYAIALAEQRAWLAQGFAGIHHTDW